MLRLLSVVVGREEEKRSDGAVVGWSGLRRGEVAVENRQPPESGLSG